MIRRPLPPDWVALSSPGHKRPLVPRVERMARGLRDAAAQIEAAIDVPFEELYRPMRPGLGFTLDPSSKQRRSAWALVGEWLVAASVGAPCAADGPEATHEWFWAGSGRELGAVPDVTILIAVASSIELRALMPYLLDPMAAATRRDVLNDQSALHARRARKASGVYYTPGDVAYLMVQRLVPTSEDSHRHRWLDPAHGSGVFLRAVLSAIYDEPDAVSRIYGIDLDPLAAETSSFVLTAEDMVRTPKGPPPWERWHGFRRNLVTANALLADVSPSADQLVLTFEAIGGRADGRPLGSFEPWRVGTVFPETAEEGFARIVANPPYAPMARTTAGTHVAALHPVTGPTAQQDVSPVFVELCANLLSKDGALSVVLPLSVVSSTRAPFPDLREHLASQPGTLELLSFDRVPDALFGDDIKTRNSIVHLDKSAPRGLSASPLYRWTSRTREEALANIPVTSIAACDDVPRVIPKIGTEWEGRLLMLCGRQPRYLEDWHVKRSLMPLTSVTSSVGDEQSDVLAVAPTAYNFLGVVREPFRAATEGHDSQNSFSVTRYLSEEHASAAYALLSSRLAFWIWHITGDGFHVTGAIYRRVPIPDSDEKCVRRLASLGDRLWKVALQEPTISSNRGRTTVSYPTSNHVDLVNEIDDEVGSFIGVNYVDNLSRWHERLVVVDLNSERRNLIQRKM